MFSSERLPNGFVSIVNFIDTYLISFILIKFVINIHPIIFELFI
jgi:hypothetical protein